MQPYQQPELKRAPLDEIALLVKMLPGEAAAEPVSSFLARAIDPPAPIAVAAAVELLEDIGAFDEDERLTPLGRILAVLPLPPQLGNLLLYGALFGCLDAVLTVACAISYRYAP